MLLFVPLAAAVAWLLAYLGVSSWVWLAFIGLLPVLVLLGGAAPGAAQAAWASLAAWAAGAAVLLVRPLRRRLLTGPLLRAFRRRTPPLSATEREALEAGTAGWEASLFQGRPDWPALLDPPPASLTAEEQAFLDGPVESLCAMLDDAAVQRRGDLPPEVWAFLKANGFFGLVIERRYGGLGFSALAHAQVILKLASRSGAAVVTVMVPNALGPGELLARYGTEAQKARFLPRLARGEEIPCFALTGPEAGSDAAATPDQGVVAWGAFEGREVLGVRLDWDKRYITLAPVATLLGLAFRLRDPDRLLPAGAEGITLALIPAATPGVTLGERHDPLGVPFQVGPTRGRGVFIPLEWIIGGPAQAGRGWRMLMECLAAGRAVSLPALSVGVAKLTALAVGGYARVRRQFRLPIGRFEGVAEPLARIASHLYAMDAARVFTCAALDRGARPAVASAIVKHQCTERMRSLVNDGMDILAGAGICLGPRNLLARAWQCTPIGITVEGANLITRSMILYGQGVMRGHPHLLAELRALEAEDPEAAFEGALAGHLRFTLGCFARAGAQALAGGRLGRVPGGPARPYFRAANQLAAAFAAASEASLLLLGGDLKRREALSGRLADALAHLYFVAASLRRFEAAGREPSEFPLLACACETSLGRAEEALDGLLRNLPFRPAAALLRRLVLPWGRRWHGPGDALVQRAARTILEPGALRDRLCAGVFLPLEPSEPLRRLEAALALTLAAEPLERRLAGAIPPGPEAERIQAGLRAGLLEPAQAALLNAALEARREVIQVDAFPAKASSRS